jgi:ABC-type dipeptide/oligopeptide/nickel transport system permease subunit
MSYLNSLYQASWLKMMGADRGASLVFADGLWGMPWWLAIAIVVVLVLALLAWLVGSDVARYIRIRNM